MNILIIGSDNEAITQLCKSSKFVEKVFTASENDTNTSFCYSTVQELVEKSKHIKIETVIVTDKNINCDELIQEFSKNRINLLCVNEKWKHLETSKIVAKSLMNYYSVLYPKTLRIPAEFPVVLKKDNSENHEKIFVNSMDELIKKRKEILEQDNSASIILEEYLQGEEYTLVSLWDAKSFFHFPLFCNLTEVQQDRLDLLKTKLSFMFSDEKANFTGFLVTRLLWAKNDWYVLEFNTHIKSSDLQLILENFKTDFGYVINSAIYQNLNELSAERY